MCQGSSSPTASTKRRQNSDWKKSWEFSLTSPNPEENNLSSYTCIPSLIYVHWEDKDARDHRADYPGWREAKALEAHGKTQGWLESREHCWSFHSLRPHTGRPNPLNRTFMRFQKQKLPSHLYQSRLPSTQDPLTGTLASPSHSVCLQATEGADRKEIPAFKTSAW